MKLFFRPAVILLILIAIISPSPAADKAKNLFKKGRDAEARQNYEQAYDFYKQAYDLSPTNLGYRASFERLRFLAGASHVHRGQLLRDAGQLDAALAEFQKAVEIDPSSAVAKQEVQRTQEMIEAAKATPTKSSAPPPNYLQNLLQHAGGPVELASISNVPINLKITEDSKVIYETVGKLAGINVLFDPDYTSRRIKIELNNVSLQEALQIIAVETKTFWRPVTANTIFVAADNPAKRKDLEQVVVKTFYLSNLSQPTELQDVTNAMRQILEINRIQPLPSESAIVVRGTPDQLALAQWLVEDLDRSKSEVVVDVAVMQVNRSKSRTLGINPPTSATVQLQQNVNTNTTNTNTNQTGTTSNSGNGSINLNTLGNLNATDFTVTISQATATALFSDSDTRLIQKPQIRAIDGQKATLKIGQRVPVATGSFQPGIGGVGINPLVNTQFQYIDVGVNIDVTPRVHANGDVTLKVTMEVSEVDSTSNIGGIDQPVIGQRKIEHEVRLREGEVNLLGGMMENQQSRALTGFPLLSQIPILKYLFGQTTTQNSETETVFALIPHIVRKQVFTDLNQQALDIGTASAISLRRVSRPETPSTAPAAPAQAPAAQPQGQPPQAIAPIPQSAQAPTPAPIAASFGFDPPTITQPKGATFAVNVLLNGAQNAYSVPLQVTYDPKILQVVNVSNGTLLSQDGQAVALVHRDDDSTGTLQITATRPPGANGISGAGPVVTLTFMAKTSGQSNLAISKGGMRDPGMQPTLVNGASASVTIQ
ncbi:MAG: type II and III secretion system protein [Acidobacteriaceae bacterium]|nr:type II and III secretion system protein [Acidobacteriaceae bacterium]